MEDKGPGQREPKDQREGGGRAQPANETMREKPWLQKPFLPNDSV